MNNWTNIQRPRNITLRSNGVLSFSLIMEFTIEKLLWSLIFADSIVSNVLAWFFPQWYKKKFKTLSKLFPASKGWCFWYLAIVLWLGYALLRID